MSTTEPVRVLTGRDRALLTAVAAGRAELTCGCEPDLFIDALCCCDQLAAHALAHAGLITADLPSQPCNRAPARLTHAGATALELSA